MQQKEFRVLSKEQNLSNISNINKYINPYSNRHNGSNLFHTDVCIQIEMIPSRRG